MPEPTVRTTGYTVSCIPEGSVDAHVFEIQVEYAGRGRWAVRRLADCLDVDGEWDYEMRPSEREDGWLDQHRFDLDTALKLAKEAAPKITVNGWTVGAVLARMGGADRG